MLRAEGPRHTSVQQSLRYRGLQHTDFQTKWSGRPIIHSGPNRLKHAQMRRIHRSISNEKSAHSWMTPPRYRNWFVCRYLWPAASMSKRIFENMPVITYPQNSCDSRAPPDPLDGATSHPHCSLRDARQKNRRRSRTRRVTIFQSLLVHHVM